MISKMFNTLDFQPLHFCHNLSTLPPRFSEWSLASWSIQRELLQDASKDLDVRFLATYHSDSVADLTAAKEALMGRLINDFWDSSEAAGSKRRECTTFSQPLPSLETLVVTDDGELKFFARN